MAIRSYLFDAEGHDHAVTELDQAALEAVGERQILWIDIEGNAEAERDPVLTLLDVSSALRKALVPSDAQPPRPRLDLYNQCFHFNVQAVQERDPVDTDIAADEGARVSRRGTAMRERSASFRLVTVHFIVFKGIVLTLHGEPADFLTSFDRRIKGDSHLGTLDSPMFVGALLNWHITGYFRAMESLEAEVDNIDDAALRPSRGRREQDLLRDMVRVRRRLALVRRALLPHREVYATLARPLFAPFVTDQATATLGLVAERMDRAIEATENARELILGSFDIFSTQTVLRTNEVVKTLTVISALLLPAGVIINLAMLVMRAPVYDVGRVGFWVMLIGMIGVGATFLAIARKRRWL